MAQRARRESWETAPGQGREQSVKMIYRGSRVRMGVTQKTRLLESDKDSRDFLGSWREAREWAVGRCARKFFFFNLLLKNDNEPMRGLQRRSRERASERCREKERIQEKKERIQERVQEGTDLPESQGEGWPQRKRARWKPGKSLRQKGPLRRPEQNEK